MAILRSFLITAALPLVLGASCTQTGTNTGDACSAPAAGAQGWTECDQLAWYTASQGSRMIPQSWLHALEQPDNAMPFLDPTFVAGFRYLPSPVSAAAVKKIDECPLDPALPLGFTVDCQSDQDLKVTHLRWKSGQSDKEPWVGMNCSACHTAELTYQPAPDKPLVTVRVDGGPTMADFQSFTEAMDRALINTNADDAKFGRFAAAVLGQGAAPVDVALLRAALQSRIKWSGDLARLNGDPNLDGSPMKYGFGRLDAIGHIFNKVALTGMADNGAAQTANPSDAPVSYPFLWNVPQLNRVEWDGLAQNAPVGSVPGVTFDYGALGRNTGEVLGVFADITIKPGAGKLEGYVSSINEPALQGMEQQIARLKPPVWPAEFPPINQPLAGEGAQVFKDRHCDTCHTVPESPANLQERYTVTLSRVFPNGPQDPNLVGTDFWMACNVALDVAKSGAFAGSPQSFVTGDPISAPNALNAALVRNAVAGALIGKKGDVIANELEGIFGINRGLPPVQIAPHFVTSAKERRRNACMTYVDDAKNPLMVYKGRPLQGIWATAPYLHNGSVPTLYDLLLPPDQRPAVFNVGTRMFDPVHVGFKTDPAPDNGFVFTARDPTTHAPVDGNSNAGHDYGNASLTPHQRDALVEYMKTL